MKTRGWLREEWWQLMTALEDGGEANLTLLLEARVQKKMADTMPEARGRGQQGKEEEKWAAKDQNAGAERELDQWGLNTEPREMEGTVQDLPLHRNQDDCRGQPFEEELKQSSIWTSREPIDQHPTEVE